MTAAVQEEVVTRSSSKPRKKKTAHISVVFDLVNDGPPSNIARDKDQMVAEAVRYGSMNPRDHSPIFKLFHRAILQRQQITMRYKGKPREICPHILGYRDGKEVVLAYQFAGESTRPDSVPDWRCFYLAEVVAPATRDGPWHGGASHRQRQQCVDVVYIDVNTEVPNQPGRRPGALEMVGK
jgi:predicted DNA-binding transcriptional regulator YafY